MGATAATIMPGVTIGSSPWIITTMSASTRSAASATRSLARSCAAEVMTAVPPNPSTAALISSSHVAT